VNVNLPWEWLRRKPAISKRFPRLGIEKMVRCFECHRLLLADFVAEIGMQTARDGSCHF
jgi:hypothetical protein